MNNGVLIGCGILQKEILFLIDKHHWPLETFFLHSSLHIDFEQLATALDKALQRFSGRPIAVCYGVCHPKIGQMLEYAHATRTPGQNCIEMLLGKQLFTLELAQGAFFLLEDWALHWNQGLGQFFGDEQGTRLIFQSEHSYLLGIQTCCSSDFTRQAEEVSQRTGLPLRWMTVSLDHFEHVLQKTIGQQGVI